MAGDEGENYSEIEIYLARNEYHDAGSNRGRERIYSEAINEVSHGGRASYFTIKVTSGILSSDDYKSSLLPAIQ